MNDFEEIFAQNYDIVYGYIMKRCADPHLAEELLCDDEEMFTKLENEEMKQLILSKIHCLQEPYREVFYLRILGDLSFREIGKIMEKNESWARVTYYRARMQIKEELS